MANQDSDSVYDMQSFLSKLNDFENEDRLVVVFLSSWDSNGKYWCPDCEQARDNISDILVPKCKEQNLKIIFVDCGDKPGWQNPEHVLKVHPLIKLPDIPTFMIFEKVF